MNILVVAATDPEITPFRQYLEEKRYHRKDCMVNVLIGGVGLMHTTYSLTRYLSGHTPDIVLQAGIGGSFHPYYPPGTVVAVKEEIVADMGVEEEGVFKDLFDLKLQNNCHPYINKTLVNPHYTWLDKINLNEARGISVNEITTHPEKIHWLREGLGAVVESMEGAALHYVCLQEQVPFIQLRAISNFVGERDKAKWKMQEAVANLNEQLIRFVHSLLC